MSTPEPRRGRTAPGRRLVRLLPAVALLVATTRLLAGSGAFGVFDEHADVGKPAQAGAASYERGDYVITGGGANMWFQADALHYLWTKRSGDLALGADVSFPRPGGNPHRKAVLMFRQSLEPGAPYVDVAFHGDGLTSLQYREEAGGVTREVQTTVEAPARVQLEKIGDYFYLLVVGPDGDQRPAGCSVRVKLTGPYLVGLGVCAHDDAVTETARFENVALGPPSYEALVKRSLVEYVKVPSGDRVCVYASGDKVTGAAWAADGALLFTRSAGTFRVPAKGGSAAAAAGATLPAGTATAVSPDGKWSATLTHEDGVAVLTLRPAAGGEARELLRAPDQADAPRAISWSADSAKLAYVRYQPTPAR